MSLPPLSIVIPVYNERRGLPPTVERLAKLLAQLPAESEVLLIDDGSRDGTREWLESLEPRPGLRVHFHARNRGYGAALKTGIRLARHEQIAIADADGTYPLEKLPEMLALFVEKSAAMVVGARPPQQVAAVRRPAKAVLRALAEYLSEERIPDLNSGLRIFLRADADRLSTLLPNGFSFTTTITMALLTEGRTVLFHPIRYKVRIGNSKIRPIRDTAGFAMLICRVALAFNPMKVFGPMGVGLIALGVLFLVLRMLLPQPVGVATTVILLVGGFQILALGLLADLINRRGGR